MDDNNNKKKYLCHQCGRGFTRPNHLDKHIKTQHQGVRYQCTKCKRTYNSDGYRKRHEKTCPGIVYECEQCGQEYYKKGALELHQRNVHYEERQREPQPSTSRTEPPLAKRPRPERVEVDPILPTDDLLPQGEDELDASLREEYRNNWSAIRTAHRTQQKVQDVYNFRLEDIDVRSIYDQLQAMFRQQTSRFKVNVSYGFILRNSETRVLRYYHSSPNQGRLLDIPHLITNQEDFNDFLEGIGQEDVLEWARQQRPDTKWVVMMVTNLTVFVNKMPDHPIGCPNINLPDYIKNNKAIIGMDKHHQMRTAYQDSLCFFRALAIHKGVSYKESSNELAGAVESYFQKCVGGNSATFEGVMLTDLPELEKKLEMCINVYQLIEKEGLVTSELVQRSHRNYQDVMNLNLFENHFSLITNMDQYCKSYKCRICEGKLFPTYKKLHRHEKTCDGATKRVFVGGIYKPEPAVFELLEDEGILVEEKDKYYPYRIVYDFESYFDHQGLARSTEKQEWQARHEPLSVSVKSNVPGYTQAKWFVTDGDPGILVDNMVAYMLEIQQTANTQMSHKHQKYYNKLLQLIERRKSYEPGAHEEPMEVDGEDNKQEQKHPLDVLKHKYEAWMAEIPTIGFNSQRYDLNLVKPYLLKSLKARGEIKFVVKRSNALACIQTDKLRFLDICNYLAPGYSYAKYLRAYDCTESKGFFCYEWMDDLKKLDYPQLPEHQAFYSSLKKTNISTEEYAFCQQVWIENNMTCFRQYLEWYNHLDVSPFLEALQKQFAFYRDELHLDLFKDAISVPGLTLKYLFKTVDTTNTNFTLVDQYNSDLHDLIKKWNVGGPSIVFSRYQERGETKINPHIYGEEAKTCQSVVGWDANALYLACLMEDMPTGPIIRRKAEDNFAPKQTDVFGRMASEWLEWVAHRDNIKITHKYNGKEKRIGKRLLPVDGYCATTMTCYQFHGDYWHGCECQGDQVNKKNGKTMAELKTETKKNSDYIRQCGYNLVEMWECAWKQTKQDPTIRQFLNEKFKKPLANKKNMTQGEILQAVVDGKLFGLVQCDIETPPELRAHFAEMTPIFKNIEVSRDDIGETMKAYVEKHGLMTRPRKTLVGSYHAKAILLATPLLRWYLLNGLKVTHIYQTVEYTPKACFKEFGEKVSAARRKGDENPDYAIIADTMKLLGNSGYGKTITNKDRHRQIYYCDDKDAPDKINELQFRQLNALDDDLYEIDMAKKKIKYDLPIHIGFFVYQYAKLKMLEFYFGCILKFVDPRDFCYVEMDTDSAYLALSGPSLHHVIKPELRKQFYEEWDRWFPAEACDTHREEFVATKLEGRNWHPDVCCVKQKKYDRRTAGLFKIEWEGSGMIALCSKCYFGWGEEGDKRSTKGLNKDRTPVNREMFKDVLETMKPTGGYNMGFQMKNNRMYTYKQWRSALSFLYPKRKVLADGISSVPLDI